MARHRWKNPKQTPSRVAKAAVALGAVVGIAAVFSTGFALFVAILAG